METPTIEAEDVPIPERQRDPFGWVLLAAMSVLLIAGQLYSALVPSAAADRSFDTQVAALKTSMKVFEAFSDASPGSRQTFGGDVRSSLNDLYEDAKPYQGQSEEAAKVVLVAGAALGKPSEKTALKTAADSDLESVRSYAELYGSKSIRPSRADELKFGDDFLAQLAERDAISRSGRPPPAMFTSIEKRAIVAALVFAGAALMLGALILIVFVGLLFSKKLVPAEPLAVAKSLLESDTFAMRAVLALWIALGANLVLGVVPGLSTEVSLAIGMTAAVVLLPISLKLKFHEHGTSLRSLMGKTRPVAGLAGLGLAGSLATMPVALLLAVVSSSLLRNLPPPEHPVNTAIQSGSGLWQTAVLFWAAAVAAPFIEEITFRGLVFPGLATQFGAVRGIVFSSLLFAAIHPQGPILWLSLASIGAMAACLRHFSGSLVPSMVMHAANNAAVLTMAMVLS